MNYYRNPEATSDIIDLREGFILTQQTPGMYILIIMWTPVYIRVSKAALSLLQLKGPLGALIWVVFWREGVNFGQGAVRT